MQNAIQLPWPPSLNKYWRNVAGRTLLSSAGRQYKHAVNAVCLLSRVRKLPGRVAVTIDAHPPDRRKRDLDNLLKSILDALAGHCYADDSQIDRIVVQRREVVSGGLLRVLVESMS